MLLAELIAQFRFEVGDFARTSDGQAAPYLWRDDEVTLYFNEAQDEAAIRARLLRDKITQAICRTDVVAGLASYPLDPRITELVYAGMVTRGNPTMIPYRLQLTTSDVLDQVRPAWRSLSYRPGALIHYDNALETDGIPDAAYTINLEAYRLPLAKMGSGVNFTGSIALTTMTVTFISSGMLAVGQTLTGAAANTTILAQLSGEVGKLGTYQVSQSQTLASTTLSFSGAVTEVLAAGTLTLATGAAGSVNTVLVNGVDVLGAAVPYNTSLTQTAADVVTQINANQGRYTASSLNAVITLTDLATTGSQHNGYTVSATCTTLTTTSTAFSGGVDALVLRPEIHANHHRHLVKWAKHRAYEKQDADTQDLTKSTRFLKEFEEYFGVRPDASYRKRIHANRPHVNRAY